MDTAIVVMTRNLRVHDNPALALACAAAQQVVPVFVADPALTVPPNRGRFLAQSIGSLRKQLRRRGGDLVIRHGDPVAEVMRMVAGTGAQAVFIADDVSRYAALRRCRLEAECARHRLRLTITPGHAVIPAGELQPASGGHYRNLCIDWRHGYRHFRELLADGDVACNAGNWQWVAGTGNNPRPGRVLNPLRQAARFDPRGDYVRHYVPELASLSAPYVHTPWKLSPRDRRQLQYPDPLAEVG